MSVGAGPVDQTELVKPALNLYLSSKIETTPIDPDLKGFPKMPS